MKSPLLQSLFDETERRPWTVSELNEQVRAALERGFSNVWVEGEITNFVAANSGHWYFTLHDGFSQLKAACYIRNNMRIRFQPFDGLQVRVRGKLSVYEPKGEYQILVESLEPHGEGALKIAFEQIKAKLAKEGLFDEDLKRGLPFFPRRVGVVTSPNGAAFYDVLNVLSRRTRTVHITLIPTRVQGETAGEEIESAILLANKYNRAASAEDKIDVLIVGRGGGSAEDLWAFNEERVARAIRASAIPVISAVGHEIDYTIADMVADMRAPTPSAAAEIVAESELAIEQFIDQKMQDMAQSVNYRLLELRSRTQELTLSPAFKDIPWRVVDLHYEVDDCRSRIQLAYEEKLKNLQKRLESFARRMSPVTLAQKVAANKTQFALLNQRHETAALNSINTASRKLNISMTALDALSPLSVLKRGYSIVQNKNDEILRVATNVREGDDIKIRLAKGRLNAQVKKVESGE